LHHTAFSGKVIRVCGSWICSVVFTVAALKYLSIPYVWISLCWFLCCLFFILQTKIPFYKAIGFNMAFLFFTFGLIEAFSWVSLEEVRFEGGYNEGYVSSDEILGYAPAKRGPVTQQSQNFRYAGG
jgi:hypothetical protein